MDSPYGSQIFAMPLWSMEMGSKADPRTPSTRMDTMNQNPNTTKQAEGGHSRAAAGSDYECGDEVTIEGHGTRTVNAQIGEYLFLDTDTDGPFIDAVHVSFVHNAKERDAL